MMTNKDMLYKANKKALEQGIDARLSIQFIEEPNGKMSVLSCSIIRGYDNVDYGLSLDSTLGDVIKDLLD